MRHTILTIRDHLCHYPVGDDKPQQMFCGEPVANGNTPYCGTHHRLCNAGFGKRSPEQLADMICSAEQTVLRVTRPRLAADGSYAPSEHTVPVDVVVRE